MEKGHIEMYLEIRKTAQKSADSSLSLVRRIDKLLDKHITYYETDGGTRWKRKT